MLNQGVKNRNFDVHLRRWLCDRYKLYETAATFVAEEACVCLPFWMLISNLHK